MRLAPPGYPSSARGREGAGSADAARAQSPVEGPRRLREVILVFPVASNKKGWHIYGFKFPFLEGVSKYFYKNFIANYKGHSFRVSFLMARAGMARY